MAIEPAILPLSLNVMKDTLEKDTHKPLIFSSSSQTLASQSNNKFSKGSNLINRNKDASHPPRPNHLYTPTSRQQE